MLSNGNLAGHCNTIRKKLEVLAHAIRLMYKSCNNGQRLGFPVFQLMYFFSQLDYVFPESFNYTLFHIKNEVTANDAIQKMFFWRHKRIYVCVVCSFERKPVWDKSSKSLCQLALATFRIILFVFIRTRMGM